ncbi:MAG: phosphoribosylamine--glycine ligase N-terminal domain-containing protein, partial [Myxococcota bacterium]|nr:phosphoribosylamine--glycine ligase N-terminal domain-containing protein [Myxococcota bacterium]
MHVLLVGGGGREHALAWRLCQSPRLTRLSVTAANPGFQDDAAIVRGDVVAYAVSQGVDLVVVGPEGPLAAGLVDRLGAAGIPAFGPCKAA